MSSTDDLNPTEVYIDVAKDAESDGPSWEGFVDRAAGEAGLVESSDVCASDEEAFRLCLHAAEAGDSESMTILAPYIKTARGSSRVVKRRSNGGVAARARWGVSNVFWGCPRVAAQIPLTL